MNVSYYPPRIGGQMRITLTEMCAVAIAVALWVWVLFGANLL